MLMNSESRRTSRSKKKDISLEERFLPQDTEALRIVHLIPQSQLSSIKRSKGNKLVNMVEDNSSEIDPIQGKGSNHVKI